MSPGTVRYLKVWGWLTALTAAEVLLAMAPVPRAALVAGLAGMALWKALLVVLEFMHLKLESRWLWAAAALPAFLSLVAVALILSDSPLLRR